MTDLVRAEYELLTQVATDADSHVEKVDGTLRRLLDRFMVLRRGEWIGAGADRFFVRMEQEVLSALQRTRDALALMGETTRETIRIFQEAEEDAGNAFPNDGGKLAPFRKVGVGQTTPDDPTETPEPQRTPDWSATPSFVPTMPTATDEITLTETATPTETSQPVELRRAPPTAPELTFEGVTTPEEPTATAGTPAPLQVANWEEFVEQIGYHYSLSTTAHTEEEIEALADSFDYSMAEHAVRLAKQVEYYLKSAALISGAWFALSGQEASQSDSNQPSGQSVPNRVISMAIDLADEDDNLSVSEQMIRAYQYANEFGGTNRPVTDNYTTNSETIWNGMTSGLFRLLIDHFGTEAFNPEDQSSVEAFVSGLEEQVYNSDWYREETSPERKAEIRENYAFTSQIRDTMLEYASSHDNYALQVEVRTSMTGEYVVTIVDANRGGASIQEFVVTEAQARQIVNGTAADGASEVMQSTDSEGGE